MLQESEPDQTLLLALGNTLPSSWVPLMRTLSRVVNREVGDLRCRLLQPLEKTLWDAGPLLFDCYWELRHEYTYLKCPQALSEVLEVRPGLLVVVLV